MNTEQKHNWVWDLVILPLITKFGTEFIQFLIDKLNGHEHIIAPTEQHANPTPYQQCLIDHAGECGVCNKTTGAFTPCA